MIEYHGDAIYKLNVIAVWFNRNYSTFYKVKNGVDFPKRKKIVRNR